MGTTTPTAQAYFTTTYVFGNSTTSTLTLKVWKVMSDFLALHHRPMTGAELMEATGASAEELEDMFSQPYYQKYYGFRRFNTLEEWEQWARERDILYDPARHGVQAEASQEQSQEQPPEQPQEPAQN
ncbi:MAG TPA: hypothetical protein VIL07_07195 [Symbiobacteriaceae bacterium]